MAWRPYQNLLDGELDNRRPEKVVGWIRFFRQGKKPLKVTFDLSGDFHEDIRGKVIRLSNPKPSDKNGALGRDGTYMEGFAVKQRGPAGDITAGLSLGPWTQEIAQTLMAQNEKCWDEYGVHESEREESRQKFAKQYQTYIDAGELYYPYSAYPYIEWFSDKNGRVVLELESSQVEVIDGDAPVKAKTPAELANDERNRANAFSALPKTSEGFFRESRDEDIDTNVVDAVGR